MDIPWILGWVIGIGLFVVFLAVDVYHSVTAPPKNEKSSEKSA
jgi:hypothetical protein